MFLSNNTKTCYFQECHFFPEGDKCCLRDGSLSDVDCCHSERK
jgi:hypothetical protein